MQLRSVLRALTAVGLTTLSVQMAWGGDLYNVSVVPEPGTTSPFAIGTVSKGVFTVGSNGSKVVIKPSSKAGDGGLTIQLILKNVDCASYSGVDDPVGNNKGTRGKCGVVGTKASPAMPALHHVMEMSVNFLGLDLDSVAGIPYQIQNGVATFAVNGKNKVGGAALFGSLVAATFSNPLAFGLIKFRDAYRVCTSRAPCLNSSQCASGNACVGGACVQVGAACDSATPCDAGQTCFNDRCVAAVLCGSDSDCTSPETCVDGICAGQTTGGSGVRCNLNSDCAASTATCANPGQVVACSSAPLTSASPCFAGTVYAKAGITVGCDAALATCP